MANCEFPKMFGEVRGTLSKTRIVTPDGVVIRRVVAQVRNGKQKIYLQTGRMRSTKVTEKEILQRRIFAAANAYVQNLTEYLKNVWMNMYKCSPESKKYKTVQGYIKAATMKYLKAHPEVLDDFEKGVQKWEPDKVSI